MSVRATAIVGAMLGALLAGCPSPFSPAPAGCIGEQWRITEVRVLPSPDFVPGGAGPYRFEIDTAPRSDDWQLPATLELNVYDERGKPVGGQRLDDLLRSGLGTASRSGDVVTFSFDLASPLPGGSPAGNYWIEVYMLTETWCNRTYFLPATAEAP